MMLKRTRTASAAAALAGGALLLAGCGGQAATNSAVAPESQQGDAPGAVDIGKSSDCTAADFTYRLDAQPQHAPGSYVLSMKNTSDKPCQVDGYPVLTPKAMDGKEFQVPSQDADVPGAPEEFVVDPGKSAYAGVKFELTDKGDPDAKVATGFNAKASNMNGPGGNVDEISPSDPETGTSIPVKSVRVGTMQPIDQGLNVGL